MPNWDFSKGDLVRFSKKAQETLKRNNESFKVEFVERVCGSRDPNAKEIIENHGHPQLVTIDRGKVYSGAHLEPAD